MSYTSEKLEKHRFDVAFEDLQTFLAVADFGSFSRAAEHLNLTQPAVSNRIKRLEDKLTARLLHRTSRKVALTPEGSILRGQATEALFKLHQLFKNFDRTGQERARCVRVAATPLLAAMYLPPVISAFQQRFPGHHIFLNDLNVQDAHRSVLEGWCDLAVLAIEYLPRGLVSEPLLDEPSIVITSRNHPLSGHGPVTLEEALRYPLLLPAHYPRLNEAVEAAASERHLEVRCAPEAAEIGNSITLLAMVAAGVGILPFCERLIPDELRPAIGLVSLSDCEIRRRFGIVRSRSTPLRQSARHFAEFLSEQASRSCSIGAA